MANAARVVIPAAMIACLALPECANAVELTGAWVAYADKCDAVFVRRGRASQIGFTQFPGVHGGGFIIDANQLRGKFAKCTIKTRKEDGQSLNLIAACATDIMLSNVQFVLKVVDDDNITRVFPGVDGMEIKYHRCRL
jgi:predicted sugar kinase